MPSDNPSPPAPPNSPASSNNGYQASIPTDSKRGRPKKPAGRGKAPTPGKPQLELVVDGHRKRPYERNPALLNGGEANPQYGWENLERYGYPCPRLEYVESPACPTLVDLAAKWGATEAIMGRWKSEGGWDQQRHRFWQEVTERQSLKTQEAIASLRDCELEEQRTVLKLMRDAIKATARHGVVYSQNSLGERIEDPLGPRDWRDLAMALQMINTGINETLGMNRALLKMGEAETGHEVVSVRKVVYNYKVEVQETAASELPGEAQPQPLPEPNQVQEAILTDLHKMADTVEGEVVETQSEAAGWSEKIYDEIPENPL